jgi:hypothetical protein
LVIISIVQQRITGSASSYARKYALNGLFAIDDTKDSDHESQHVEKVEVPFKPCNENQIKIINDLIIKKGADKDKFLKAFEVFNVEELSFENAGKSIILLNKKKDASQ